MNIDNPKISLLCPSYNHQKFFNYFIQSVLNQTEQNFELIIVDDASSDSTVQEIEKISDLRIKLIKHEYNKGINAALNDAFAIAKGKYCVFIASDDILEPNHLEVSSLFLDSNSNVDVFYSSLKLIDDQNKPILDKEKIYIRNNSNRFELLEKSFFYGNQLLAPGMTIRKDALEKIMPLDLGMLQYQDYQMHVLLMLNSEIHQSEQTLVNYRQISGDKNISSQIPKVFKRESLEEYSLMNSFLKIKDVELLKNIFGDKLSQFGKPTIQTIPYFLGRLALLSKKNERRNWGYHTLMNFIQGENNLSLLYDLYKFNFAKYIELVEFFDYKKQADETAKIENKLKKYKTLFNCFLVVSIFLFFVILIGFISRGL